jgi:hypothetical protein
MYNVSFNSGRYGKNSNKNANLCYVPVAVGWLKNPGMRNDVGSHNPKSRRLNIKRYQH